ncbi:MAG TPA: prepilin-type N-terminal cleavage/methylation domain-containing protein [Longimicrobiales bacterium]|nr:prepilin-type N-terminal cleavage/methylation domain-containing protein [Longimicrobiales bacterium]
MDTRKRHGFTLIELLIVVVILGVLAALAIPKFSATRGRAQITAMMADLRNLSIAQDIYHEDPDNAFTYAAAVADLPDFGTSDGIAIAILEATPNGWSARATHPSLPDHECVVRYGDAAAVSTTAGVTPTGEGDIACDAF